MKRLQKMQACCAPGLARVRLSVKKNEGKPSKE